MRPKTPAPARKARRPAPRAGAAAARAPKVRSLPGLEFSPAELAEAMNRGFEGYIVPVHLSPALFDARFRQVHLDLAASRILVASGKPVGLCLISRRGWSSYVAAAGVAPEYRGAGIARELMQECIREARARGERRMLLEVIAGNEPAVRLYGKLGFVAKRRLVGYVQTAALPEIEAPSGPDPREPLVEIDPLEFARETAREGDDGLPWMLAPETLASLAPPTRAFRMGQDARAMVLEVPGTGLFLRGILVRRTARGRGLGTALLRRLAAAHPGVPLKIPPVVPEDLAAGFFMARRFHLDSIAQLEMELDLRESAP